MSKWISVKDRLPDLGKFVILYDGLSVLFGHLMQLNAGPTAVFSVESGGGGFTSRVTHWQELPEPPEDYTTDGKKVYYKDMAMSPEYIAMLLNMVGSEIEDKAKA
jgi:hypothetical protein